LSGNDAVSAIKVGGDGYGGKSMPSEKVCDGGTLAWADFDGQPAALHQVGWGVADDAAIGTHAVAFVCQGKARFIQAYIGVKARVFVQRDVGRVGYDEIKVGGAGGERIQPVAGVELYVITKAQGRRVAHCNGQCCPGQIGANAKGGGSALSASSQSPAWNCT